MVSSCCAYGCKTRFKKNCGIGFFKFPKDPVRRKLWTLALRRKNFEPTRTSVICGQHFQTGRPLKDPEHPDYIPNIFIFKPSKVTHQRKLSLEPSNVGTENTEDIICTPDVTFNAETLSTSSSPKTAELFEMKADVSEQEEVQQDNSEVCNLIHKKDKLHIDMNSEDVSKTEEELSNLKLEIKEIYSNLHSVAEHRDQLMNELTAANLSQSTLQNSICAKEKELSLMRRQLHQAYTEVTALRKEKEELQKKLSATDATQSILQDPKKLHYYTGLNSLKDFHLVLSLFSNVETNFKYISLETQVLIVLMKLKLNLWLADLGYRFKTSASTIHRICETIIPFLETKLDQLLNNPINNALKKNIPVGFKNTVYENLYQRLQKNAKLMTSQSKKDSMDLDEM